ncbi:MAG: DUF1566 domain-containing protein [Treponema sp.]|nr:DUF1566 domain-containing protein [Treponema sp.]MCL2237301.1 DUF1566 domain-containing protein [Treponema sp.]
MKNRLLHVIFVFSVIAFCAFLFASCGCSHSDKTPIVTVPPTCIDEGYTTQSCRNCEKTITYNIIPATTGTHTVRWIMTDTTWPGISTNKCINCNLAGDGEPRATQVGDRGPASGFICFISADETGFEVAGLTGVNGTFNTYFANFLEAAPSDETSTSISWGPANLSITGATMITASSSSISATDLANSFGKGRRDTRLIFNAFSSLSVTGRAAQLCANKTVVFDGVEYKDWFLPSIGELNELRNRTGLLNILASSAYYWSSTQGSANNAWDMSATGTRSNYTRSYSCRVRAVRAFGSTD